MLEYFLSDSISLDANSYITSNSMNYTMKSGYTAYAVDLRATTNGSNYGCANPYNVQATTNGTITFGIRNLSSSLNITVVLRAAVLFVKST